MKKVIYFLFSVLVSIVMISCSDMTVSSGYTYDPYPYSNYYYYYYRPYYYYNPYYYYGPPYRPVYRERIIVVPQRRNNNNRNYDNKNRTFGNGQRFGNGNFQFGQRQRNNSSTTGHFCNGRR